MLEFDEPKKCLKCGQTIIFKYGKCTSDSDTWSIKFVSKICDCPIPKSGKVLEIYRDEDGKISFKNVER